MSIRPPSDIILDVAQAAEPLKARTAIERLLAGASLAHDSKPPDFETVLATAKPDRKDPREQVALLGTKAHGERPSIDARTKAYEGLERLVLQSLVETMLPRDSGTVFGRGTAGDIWRSMLAEELAAGLGKSIDLGLAKSALSEPVAIKGMESSAAVAPS